MNPTDTEICEAILEWAKTRPTFEPRFVEDLYARLKQGKTLTPRQHDALMNIVTRFGIEL